jgi:hypothetical protein
MVDSGSAEEARLERDEMEVMLLERMLAVELAMTELNVERSIAVMMRFVAAVADTGCRPVGARVWRTWVMR